MLSFLIAITLTFLITGLSLRANGKDFFGRPPINKVWYRIGKSSEIVCFLFIFFQMLTNKLSPVKIPDPVSWVVVAIFIMGVIISVIGFIDIGASLRMGLTDDKTTLKTGGIYKLTRNPMYLGFHIIGLSSCIYVPNPINIMCFLLSVAIHHRIILGEEKFLSDRFGQKWEYYKFHTPRYI